MLALFCKWGTVLFFHWVGVEFYMMFFIVFVDMF